VGEPAPRLDGVTIEEAVARAMEIGESLGGRDKRCLEVLCRAATRGARISSTAIPAVSHAAKGAQHFVAAQRELAAGLQEIGETTSSLRAAVVGDERDPDDKEE